MTESLLKPGERLDDLQRNGLHIIQHPRAFRFGMDAVLLADFTRLRPRERVADMGTGTGILLLLLSTRTKASRLVGLEVQHAVAERARRSVAWNGLTERIEIMEGDLKCAKSLFCPNSFDLVVCNPPYGKAGHSFSGDSSERNIARHEVLCTLDDILRESGKILGDKGRFYMVHRPFRLPEILRKMSEYRLEPKRMQLVYPQADKEPNMVLLEGLKGGKPRLKVEPPLIVYEKDGSYTRQIREAYSLDEGAGAADMAKKER